MNFAAVVGVSLRSGYALPTRHPDNGIVPSTGRRSTYQGRNAPQRNRPPLLIRRQIAIARRPKGDVALRDQSGTGWDAGQRHTPQPREKQHLDTRVIQRMRRRPSRTRRPAPVAARARQHQGRRLDALAPPPLLQERPPCSFASSECCRIGLALEASAVVFSSVPSTVARMMQRGKHSWLWAR